MIRDVKTWQDSIDLSPEHAAAMWAARQSEGLSVHERALLDEWLRGNHRHREAWQHVCGVLTVLDESKDTDLLSELRSQAREAKRRPLFSSLQLAAAVAAAICLLFAAPALYGLLDPGRTTHPQIAQPAVEQKWARFASAGGQVRSLRLSDGSELVLDARTKIDVRLGRNQREFRLIEGQGLFDVAHDPARPFVVVAGPTTIRALGTRFSVKASSGEARIDLFQGRVAIQTSAGLAQILEPGQRLVDGGNGKRTISPVPHASLDWQQGMTTFDNEVLSSALAELNRYSDRKLIIADLRLRDLRITGRFRNGDPDGFAEALGVVYPVRAHRQGPDVIELKSLN
ncbi:FecR domain-containing protein [Sphingomonas sp. BN140010]|uniref:FecR domain-containing protein n=1 Tax=Sphingomonas arvum TaxID=2992113 RepID=A0ABT3JDN8_9SPHN|nr:FecR domain-containing protein [Sphingomonas sp. BN140010]MCW3797205.1 FecR domain-containing protein [Sphingomonas sp. BN140010]